MKKIRVSLLWKILLATFVAGLIPLVLITYRSVEAINATGQAAQDTAVQQLDEKSIEALRVRAVQVASEIEALLEGVASDTRYLSTLQPDAQSYQQFYQSRNRSFWYLTGSDLEMRSVVETIPLYREVAFIDLSGQEVIHIVGGKLLPPEQLRDVSQPANTTYRSETYFADALALSTGQIYVSPVTNWYAANRLQPGYATDSATSRFSYHLYEAVIRFAAPVHDAQGMLTGVVVLSLDHRHIMEISNHVQSSFGRVSYPDYASGNYAYLLDYQGWLIAHPDLSTLRGLDENGAWMETQMVATKELDYPFNMLTSDLKPQAVEISSAVLNDEMGVSHSTTRQGTPKVDIYIPIHFAQGVYAEKGIFGGVVLSEAVTNVEQAGAISSQIIGAAVEQIQKDMVWIIAVSLIFLLGATVLLARNLNQPISELTEAARIMQKGELDVKRIDHLIERRFQDEVTELAGVFKQMAQAVQMRERRLREEVTALRIQIDEVKKREEVERITQTEDFRRLQEKAAELRARRAERMRRSGE